MHIKIDASPSEVQQALSEGLSGEELTMLAVRQLRRDPFAPEPQRDLPEFQTAVEFAALAIAGGIVHDVAKAAARKALSLLKARFKERAQVEDDDADK